MTLHISHGKQPFSLESAGYCGVLEISDRTKHYEEAKKTAKTKRPIIAFQLCVAIELAPSKVPLLCCDNDVQTKSAHTICYKFYQFRRTKIVTISPLFVFINMMDKELWYTQSGVKDLSYSLLPNARIPFHWPDGGRKATREISIKLGSLWAWYLLPSPQFFFVSLFADVIFCPYLGPEALLSIG